MPLAAAGIPRDLPMVKVETPEGLFAKSLSVEIVRMVVKLLPRSSGAFLQSHRHMWASRLGTCWAIMTRTRPRLHWATGLGWVVAGLFLFFSIF